MWGETASMFLRDFPTEVVKNLKPLLNNAAAPRQIIAPVRSSDGVPAATGAVLALAAAVPMRKHYAGASARAIVEQLRRSSS